MKKRNSLLCWIGMGFFIAFTGCATPKAGIAKTDVPMSEQCVIMKEVGYGGTGEITSFYYDDIRISNDRWAGAEYGIVPAGKKKVSVYVRHQARQYSGSYVTTFTWGEQWDAEYEFQPGKYYSINVTGAPVKRSGNNISTTADVEMVGNSVRHRLNDDIEIVEDPEREMGSVYIKPYAGVTLGQKYYDYYPALHILNVGPNFGIHVIKGGLNMDFGIEGNVGGGLLFGGGEIEGIPLAVSYDYGAYLNVNLWRFVLGAGAGMGNGTVWYTKKYEGYYDENNIYHTPDVYEESVRKSYSAIPYAELYLGFSGPVFRRSTPSLGLYGRYYFLENGDNQSKIGVGMKGRL